MTVEFFFALEFSSQGVSARLLTELASQVLLHVGSSPEAVPDLAQALQEAVAQDAATSERRCDVQFHVHGGHLDILVSSNGGRVWQTSRPIV